MRKKNSIKNGLEIENSEITNKHMLHLWCGS